MDSHIRISNARLHNLKNISLDIPKNQFVVLTGLSGSGKSTLGFDILNKEGMRQYLESLGMVTFGLAKPPVGSIEGLSPSISIDQYLTNNSPRSTVGTATEVYTYLRVLFARLGRRPCPACGKEIPAVSALSEAWEEESEVVDESGEAQARFPCPHCSAPVPELGMASFSFNKPAGACATCTGLGVTHQADLSRLIDYDRSIPEGAIRGWDIHSVRRHRETLQVAARHYGFHFDPEASIRAYTPAQHDLLVYGVESPEFRRHFPEIEPPDTVGKGRFEGVATTLLRRLAERANDAEYRQKIDELLITRTCSACAGTRLRPESRAVTVRGEHIVALSGLPLTDLATWVERIAPELSGDEVLLARPVLADLAERTSRLVEVGVGYLTLDRSTPSLSAGEAQRLRLASLLGSSLSGLLYVFDEPTIGLHQRDTARLIQVLKRLRDLGNTVLVIEHDLELIRAADRVIDFGPGAGKHGGEIVAMGTPVELATMSGNLTGEFLSGRRRVSTRGPRRETDRGTLTIRGARHHNLKNLEVHLPLGVLTAVAGVSGSGKSSLVFDILNAAGRRHFFGAREAPGEHDSIDGWEDLDRLVTIDQEHIRRIPRSNAATYTETFTPIREAFSGLPEARQRGLGARHFSFNVPGGRCERCEGAGLLAVKMHFLPDVEVRCPTCHGRRFTGDVLSVKYQGYDISQVLELTVEEALELFAHVPGAANRLRVLDDVGLGYLQLGQPSTTLSGGEAQRIKLAKELGRRSSGRTLYLLDEPTTGLHPADIARLLAVLERLVDAGNTVVVVEHNLDMIQAADWVIDLGPEGGMAGGRLIAAGTPEEIAQVPTSHTGRHLKGLLDRSRTAFAF